MIPKDHSCYCEPFCGAAWIFFSKEPSESEVLNDADNELVAFWRVIQHHLQAFLEYFKFAVISRQIFEWEKITPPETLTDIQRAVRYYYMQRLAFAGKTSKRTFGTSATGPLNLNLSTVEQTLLEVHWRLKRVTIERLDALECITRYDRPTTFFYIDPPYVHSTKDYSVHFDRFLELSQVLSSLKGRFILSLGDCPEARQIFAPFRQKKVSLTYSSANAHVATDSRGQARSELLIHNLRKERFKRG